MKFVGDASKEFKETLDTFKDYSSDTINAMQDTSSALKDLRQVIEDAEREAEKEAKKEEVASILITVLGARLVPIPSFDP